MSPHWYDDRVNLVELLDFLEDRGDLATVRDAIHVVEKPWHYSAEHKQMLAARAAEDQAERDELAARRRPRTANEADAEAELQAARDGHRS